VVHLLDIDPRDQDDESIDWLEINISMDSSCILSVFDAGLQNQ
jgi:hypothetical protein